MLHDARVEFRGRSVPELESVRPSVAAARGAAGGSRQWGIRKARVHIERDEQLNRGRPREGGRNAGRVDCRRRRRL